MALPILERFGLPGMYQKQLYYYLSRESCEKLAYGLRALHVQDYSGRYYLKVNEDTNLVDGIGGTTWEGSIILGRLLEMIFVELDVWDGLNGCHLLELGCGTGMIGILAGKLGFRSTITDRFSDLAALNVSYTLSHTANNSGTSILQSNDKICDASTLTNAFSQMQVSNSSSWDVHVSNLTWGNFPADNTRMDEGEEFPTVDSLLQLRGPVHIVCGSEITCLRKQQEALVETLVTIANMNPNVFILLTFDGIPKHETSIYEREMISRMQREKFQHAIVYHGEVRWDSSQSRAILIDRTQEYFNDLSWFYFPYHIFPSDFEDVSVLTESVDRQQVPLANHHVIAFFKPQAVHTCCRCHKQFSNMLLLNLNKACRYHSGLYVCRRHPAELRLSINGQGDQLGYYGNGQEGWEANFWDCCGSEDPKCAGCCHAPHQPYT